MANKKPLIDGDPVEPTYAWVMAYNYEGHWHMIPSTARNERDEATLAHDLEPSLPPGSRTKVIKAVLLARIGK